MRADSRQYTARRHGERLRSRRDIEYNVSETNGGGIVLFSGGVVSLLASTVSGNVSDMAGGVIAYFPLTDLTLTGTKIIGNWAATFPNLKTL